MQNFTTVLSHGEEVELCPGGTEKFVTKENLQEFTDLVIKARFLEAADQMKAVCSGVDLVLDGKLSYFAYLNWAQVEIRATGEKILDIEAFKSITSYPRCKKDHEIVVRFWKVFETMFSETQRQ